MNRTLLNLALVVALGFITFKAEPAYCDKTPNNQVELPSLDQLKLPETITEEELKFLGLHTHRSHAAGPPHSKLHHLGTPAKHAAEERDRVSNRYVYAKLMDQAWTVMLYKQDIITREVAVKVLAALQNSPIGGEVKLKSLLNGDEDTASAPQIGRTLQEPMARMQLRDKQLDVIDATHDFLEVLLDKSEVHAETIMPGMTHMAHSQPTTYGAYLLSVHDGVYRGLEHLELAYKHTNENSGGCGATSGTGWPVDRYLVTELLGFDKLVEPTYDGEAGQDYAMNTLFALSNVMITLSRTAMDHGIWGMDGYHTHTLPAAHLGVSSLMPQKAHSGSAYERIRISANNVVGSTTIGILGLIGEPHGDVLTSYQAAYRAPNSGAIGALCETEMTMVIFGDMIKTMNVDRKKLLQLTRDGWGCTPDLAVKLIRDKGYGARRAHRICAVMVRIGRDHRRLMPYELTDTMLDEAARVAKEKEPGLSTKEIREIMDPVEFIDRHNNTGDPHPKETVRMVGIRRKQLAVLRHFQAKRRNRIDSGYKKLESEISAIMGTEQSY
jgi:argininosuccinate lyase